MVLRHPGSLRKKGDYSTIKSDLDFAKFPRMGRGPDTRGIDSPTKVPDGYVNANHRKLAVPVIVASPSVINGYIVATR
jgi:hypothetical protein